MLTCQTSTSGVKDQHPTSGVKDQHPTSGVNDPERRPAVLTILNVDQLCNSPDQRPAVLTLYIDQRCYPCVHHEEGGGTPVCTTRREEVVPRWDIPPYTPGYCTVVTPRDIPSSPGTTLYITSTYPAVYRCLQCVQWCNDGSLGSVLQVQSGQENNGRSVLVFPV